MTFQTNARSALSRMHAFADVTRRASQLLLAHRGLLTPPQLARLAAKMAEVGMLKEITGLVDSSVASGSHQGQAVGFVAAALTGAGSRGCSAGAASAQLFTASRHAQGIRCMCASLRDCSETPSNQPPGWCAAYYAHYSIRPAIARQHGTYTPSTSTVLQQLLAKPPATEGVLYCLQGIWSACSRRCS